METFITYPLTYLVPLINACSLDGKKSKEVKSIILSAKEEGKSCEGKHIISCHQWSESMENVGEWFIGHVIRDMQGPLITYKYKYNIYNTHTLRSSHTDPHCVYAICMKSRAPFVRHHLISTIRYAFADWYYFCLLAHIKLHTDKAMKKQ